MAGLFPAVRDSIDESAQVTVTHRLRLHGVHYATDDISVSVQRSTPPLRLYTNADVVSRLLSNFPSLHREVLQIVKHHTESLATACGKTFKKVASPYASRLASL